MLPVLLAISFYGSSTEDTGQEDHEKVRGSLEMKVEQKSRRSASGQGYPLTANSRNNCKMGCAGNGSGGSAGNRAAEAYDSSEKISEPEEVWGG